MLRTQTDRLQSVLRGGAVERRAEAQVSLPNWLQHVIRHNYQIFTLTPIKPKEAQPLSQLNCYFPFLNSYNPHPDQLKSAVPRRRLP